MIKQYYSISELLTLDIPSFPKTAFGMQKKAERECWKSQMRNKLGGGKEYLFDSLPDSAKDYILSKQIGTSSDIVKVETSVQKLPIDINELKPYQRDVIDARALILKELDQLSTVYGGINNAICKFQELINADELNEDLKNALVRANAKSGGRPVKISRATIFNWRKAVKENGTILALAQKEIKEVSIIPRGVAGGYTMYKTNEDKYYISKTEMEEKLVALLGGRAAEKIALNDISTGASNDIEVATEIAKNMIVKYGMSENLRPISINTERDPYELQMLGERFGDAIGAEVKVLLDTAYTRAQSLIINNMDKLNKVAEALLEKEVISAEEFQELIK